MALPDKGQKEFTDSLVTEAKEHHRLCIEVTFINPSDGPSIYSPDGYTLVIDGDKVSTYLPFFGRRYAAVYGTDEAAIHLENASTTIRENYSKAKKGKYIWHFSARTRNETFEFIVTFWKNGNADISCSSVNRSFMGYSGELRPMP